MSTHNSIDDMFQQHFAETTVPMNNQEELWARISEKKDKRRGGFLWFGLLGIGLLSLAGWQYVDWNSADESIAINAGAAVNIPSSQNYESDALGLVTEETTDKEETENTTNIINDNEVSTKSIADLESSSRKSVETKIKLVSDKEIEFIEINNATVESPVSIESTERPIIPVPKVAEPAMALVQSSIENRSRQITDLTVMDAKIVAPYLSTSIPPAYKLNDSWSRCEIKTPGHFFVDIYGQAGLPKDKVDFSQAGADQTAYRDLWNTRFAPKASWHTGAQIGYEFTNGLRISAGAEYQELITEYSDNQRITETIRVYDPQAFFTVDINGDRVWVGDTVTAINIYDRKFVRKNVHTLIHIPVQASYDIYKKPSFHVAVDVAAALNISKTYVGQYIRFDQTLIMIDDENQDNYISEDIGVSLSAGFHFGYYLNDNVEVYASPRFTYNPNSYLLDTETLKITRNIVALRAGVRYHF